MLYYLFHIDAGGQQDASFNATQSVSPASVRPKPLQLVVSIILYGICMILLVFPSFLFIKISHLITGCMY